MAIHDFSAQRLFIEASLAGGTEIVCDHAKANYLLNVLRLGDGDSILVFNGIDGEWRAEVMVAGKRGCRLRVVGLNRVQEDGPDIDYLFAPLKRARLDYMVQKAVEMGVSRLRPVLTRHTVAERVNGDRMRANAIEAAEQCGILRLPTVEPPRSLDKVLADWPAARPLIFCDEAAEQADPIAVLSRVPRGPVAVLIGPEGGFAAVERERIRALPAAVAISLGPRIMRADTAAVAALALVDAVLGDWRTPPSPSGRG